MSNDVVSFFPFYRFGVKYDPERKCLLFPLTSPEGVTGLKIYNLGNDLNDNKSASDTTLTFNVLPRSLNIPIGLFGWSVMPPETNEIILCTEVFDVMLLSQEKLVALSFPKGKPCIIAVFSDPLVN